MLGRIAALIIMFPVRLALGIPVVIIGVIAISVMPGIRVAGRIAIVVWPTAFIVAVGLGAIRIALRIALMGIRRAIAWTAVIAILRTVWIGVRRVRGHDTRAFGGEGVGPLGEAPQDLAIARLKPLAIAMIIRHAGFDRMREFYSL